MIQRLEPGMMFFKRKPESDITGEDSPFVTVLLARSVVRKLIVSALFLLLTTPLIVMLVIALLQYQVEIEGTDAFIIFPVLSVWLVFFLLIFLGFLISAIQDYRGSFKDLSDFKYHYRLAKSRTFSGDVIKCPKCGNEIRMIGEISSGECQTCGFEVYPKSSAQKLAKASKIFSELQLPELLNTGRKLLDEREYAEAFHVFKDATTRFPGDHEAWWGLLCAKTEMFGRLPVTPSFRSWYSKAYELAPPDIRDTYKSTFEAWVAARSVAEK